MEKIKERWRELRQKAGWLFYFSGAMIYMEMILRWSADQITISSSVVFPILVAFGVASAFCFLSSFLRGTSQNLLMLLGLFFVTFLYGSQIIYFSLFRTFYTIYSAGRASQISSFISDILYVIISNLNWIILLVIPFVLGILLLWKKKIALESTKHVRTMLIMLFFLVMILNNTLMKASGENQQSPYDLLVRNAHPVVSVDQMGLITTMGYDFRRTFFGVEESPPPVVPMPEKDVPKEPKPVEDQEIVQETDQEEIRVPMYHKTEIDFDTLIEEESNEVIKGMHEYFRAVTPSEHNDHTGLFEGYNLIFITAEAYSHYAVDEELTPTLYKMATEGYQFTDFYNPLWGVSTLDGEYVATTSLIPKTGIWSMYYSGYNHMPYAMGNKLKGEGYKTMAYHNHTYNYYGRDVSHPNLGYDYRGLGNGLEVTPTWPASDLEMMELSVDDYIQDEPFHAYYMTVSGHLRYSFSGNYIALKNRDLVTDLPFNEPARAYLATQIELDRALEYLMTRLEEEGIAENTLIVMSGDHYPYGLDIEDINELAGYEIDEKFELYQSSLIMYAKGMTSETVEKPTSSLDIIPTIMNLMGLEFDSRLLMGTDIFSTEESLVIFSDRSFITHKGKYDARTDSFTPNENVVVNEEYVKSIQNRVDEKFYYSARILDYDYYQLVLPEKEVH